MATKVFSPNVDGCVLSLLLIGGVIIVWQVAEAHQRTKAREAYQLALASLKTNPTNPTLREQALQLGRAYSHLTRNRRGVTLFDEVALMNDLNAACAAASAAPPRQSASERLARLHELKEQGLITQEEHDERRRELLREI